VKNKKKFSPFIYILPCLAFLLIFIIAYPFGYNIWASMHSYKLTNPDKISFIGIDNFVKLFNDKYFKNSVIVTTKIVLLTLIIEVFAGLGIALLLHNEFKGRNIVRVLFMMPLATVPVINGYLFKLLFFPNASVINDMLMKIGILREQVQWLNYPGTATFAMILTDCWQWIPFIMVILFAGLESIPIEPYELAKMDGMKSFKIFFKVTLPRLKFVLTIAVLIRFMDLLRLFDTVFALTMGGPRSATETIAYYIYRTGFKTFNVGLASASSIIVWAVIYIVAFITIRQVFGKKGAEA
jgi:multiple sugar transport system permease protein